MKNKDRYYLALKENKNQLNEIDLGATIGLDANETRTIIAILLAEHKINYVESSCCHYSAKKKITRKKKNDY